MTAWAWADSGLIGGNKYFQLTDKQHILTLCVWEPWQKVGFKSLLECGSAELCLRRLTIKSTFLKSSTNTAAIFYFFETWECCRSSSFVWIPDQWLWPRCRVLSSYSCHHYVHTLCLNCVYWPCNKQGCECRIARGLDEACGICKGIARWIDLLFHLVLLTCCVLGLYVMECPSGCAVGWCAEWVSQRVSTARWLVTVHPQCDSLQLWGCESSNEIPSGPVHARGDTEIIIEQLFPLELSIAAAYL